MPTYTFRCKECGKVFTTNISMNAPYPKCECGGSTVKIIGTPRFSIKGASAKNGYQKEGL